MRVVYNSYAMVPPPVQRTLVITTEFVSKDFAVRNLIWTHLKHE